MVYYHSSTIYSIFALSNTDESVVERYRHTAYGKTTVLDADGSDDADGLSDVANPYLFQSRRWESAAGIMQFRRREYAPGLGRFLQRDPLTLSVGSRRQAMEGTGELGEPVQVALPPQIRGHEALVDAQWLSESSIAIGLTNYGIVALDLPTGETQVLWEISESNLPGSREPRDAGGRAAASRNDDATAR